MITPSAPIEIPAQTGDALWILNMSISAPSATMPIRLQATIAPFNSFTNEIFRTKSKSLIINDVYDTATGDPYVANAMMAIFSGVQSQVRAKNLF